MDNLTKTHLPLTTADVATLPSGVMALPLGSHNGPAGYFAVDAADYLTMSQMRWHITKRGDERQYVCGRTLVDGEPAKILAHRFILGLSTGDGKEIDHIDGNPFHNWRSNLRICGHSVNMHNRSAFRTSKSGIKGVCWMPKQRLWCAYLNVAGKRLHTSYHKEQAPAALARLAAEVTHGVRSLQPATTHAEGLAS